ncbi:aspartate carbamoyltransferase [Candidatus Micrarchaeota archaeon CG1_02_47_40]|nr:MAG: aspartate carbamoyltransferase [Candidatus Micrarchaeota archaeon CG1_02_47_40]
MRDALKEIGVFVKHLLSVRDLKKEDVLSYFRKIEKMEEEVRKGRTNLLEDKIIATLFFEPSTRTKLSFQTAAKRLGAQVVNFNADASSLKKGESLMDTIRIIDGYVDAIVIRHEIEGAARFASEIATHPVINAGDGANQHPSQTLIDLYSIKKLRGKISGLNVTLFGDLKHARAMHSLFYGVAMFNRNIALVAPPGLSFDERTVEEVETEFGVKVTVKEKPEIDDCDVLYVCRIQKERFSDPYEAERVKKEFMLTQETLKKAKKDMIILHPLPKIDEIAHEVDSDSRAKYFQQAQLGVPVRMAILADLFGKV